MAESSNSIEYTLKVLLQIPGPLHPQYSWYPGDNFADVVRVHCGPATAVFGIRPGYLPPLHSAIIFNATGFESFNPLSALRNMSSGVICSS